MQITVLTPDREIFEGDIQSVKVPGVQGAFQVLKNHAPIVSSLEAGEVTLVTGQGDYTYFDQQSRTEKVGSQSGVELRFSIKGGFIEVMNNQVALLVQGS